MASRGTAEPPRALGPYLPRWPLHAHTWRYRIALHMQPRSAPDHEETIRQLTARLEEAEKRERRLRAFLESASQSVVAVAQSGAIVLVNAATAELFGYSREELLGASLEVLLPERLRGQHVAHRTHYFSVPRSRPMGVGMELAGRKKDGTEFPLEISLSFVSEPETNIALALITDISERKRIEEQMRQTQKLESLGVLAGGIAHDFNGSIAESVGDTGPAVRFSASSSLRFPSIFYGRPGRCQGSASPRKDCAPLTPPRPSNKSY
ncbi:MAG: sensor hybrid histidine kinase [Microvirga sp.]|nr:sensor hybrid histidine kinase [Microvirga sp.]